MSIIEIDIRLNGVVHTLSKDIPDAATSDPSPEPAPAPTPEPDPIQDPTPEPAPTPTGVTFSDTFDYDVNLGMSHADADATFVANGWNGFKDNRASQGARGDIFTEIVNGDSCLVLNLHPDSDGRQTDSWIQAGRDTTVQADFCPADVWITETIEMVDTPEKPFLIANHSHTKHIYPSNNDNVTDFNGDGRPDGMFPNHPEWLISLSNETKEPFHIDEGSVTNDFIVYMRVEAATYNGRGNPSLGYNLDTTKIPPNKKVTITHHIDTSGLNNPEGYYIQWIEFDGVKRMVAEWIGGVTEGFNWPLSDRAKEGHRALRLGTTVNDIDVTASGWDGTTRGTLAGAGDGYGDYYLRFYDFMLSK